MEAPKSYLASTMNQTGIATKLRFLFQVYAAAYNMRFAASGAGQQTISNGTSMSIVRGATFTKFDAHEFMITFQN